ncbi:sigma-70 family RNA polymerase sigma factor [Candidatus Poribacteria bacterium]|nr:sigma-70 family RNA polymerase sigma factor [Candidatus Poribacteria bacterium]MYH82318.1 sigma-70 family RNA polymerase sigma factor [Candidatus Poribacteria bacterium]MYK97153.1 sigma-70 family RNA polymerase sigma factor [Candidatus Poribacteria bacterium]
MKTNDIDLIRRVLDGDQSAFTALVNKYQKSVHALVWRKIGDFHIAEEITQDVFLKVYKRLSTLKRPELFPGWLYVIATRHCVSWLRKKELPTKSLDTMSTVELEEVCYAQYEANRGEEAAIEHQREFVKRLLQKLPESERTVVTLYYLAEMKSEEISRFLGVSSNTIRSRLRRARERLEKEEHMIHEVLSSFQIPANLTENIIREIAKIRPASPSVSKPWLPWGFSFASTFLVILMVGMGPQALSRFQQPYNLDATSEMTVELVDAPVVFKLKREIDVRNQFGKSNKPGRGSGAGPRANTGLLAAAHADTVERQQTKPQWIQKKGPVGGDIKALFVSSEKEVYAIGDVGLYRLTGDDKSEWTLINDSFSTVYSGKSMAERGDTFYILTKTNLLASTDRGVTWSPLGERPQGHPVALFITDTSQVRRPEDARYEIYLILSNGVFRSTDAGNTWQAFNNGLMAPEIQDAAAIENALFLGTRNGLYRLNAGVWEKLPAAPQFIDALTVAGDRIYLRSRRRSLFTSDDFGDSWTDITPAESQSWEMSRLSPNLVAIDETVVILDSGRLLHSTDAGNTWEDLSWHNPTFTTGWHPSVALDKQTFFVVGPRMIGRSTFRGRTSAISRSTDGGYTWHPLSIGIAETHVLQLAQVNNALYAMTDDGITKSTDGGERWTYILTELSLPKLPKKPISTLGLSNMTAIGDSLYMRAKHGGSTNCLLRLSPNMDTLRHIEGIPVYVNWRHGEKLENIADTRAALERNEIDQRELTRYLLGIEEATTRTTGEFAMTDSTFYIEYERKLYRYARGDRKWYDTGMQDTPVFEGFYGTTGFQVAASGKVVYLGKSDGSLFQSLDSGNTWKDVTANFPLPLDRTVSRTELLEKLPHFKEILFVGSTVYVSTGDGVAMSNDGENWHVLTDAEQTPIAMRHLAIDRTTLYGVTQTSAYRLQKHTGTWIQIAPEIPERVTSLVAAGNILYVGTEHRGVLGLPLQ